MKNRLKLLPVLIAAVLLFNACSENNKSQNDRQQRTLNFTDSLAFISAGGDTIATIAIAVADDQQERALGLMNITDLEQDEGMLFIFQQQKPLSFWMANTPLSLDIIFVNAEKEIVRIHHSTPPFTHENFRSGKPALYVVETNAGFAIAHDIREGMKISF